MLSEADAVRTELARIASFSKWPAEQGVTTVSLVCMAAAGFSYTGQSDRIVCGYCDAVVHGWLGTQRRPHLEHSCPSKPATHHADVDSARHTAGSYEVTAANCDRTEPKPDTNALPRDTCGLDAVNHDHDEKLTAQNVAVSPARAAASRQMALVGAQPTSRDVRDAAAANSSESMCPFLSLAPNSNYNRKQL